MLPPPEPDVLPPELPRDFELLLLGLRPEELPELPLVEPEPEPIVAPEVLPLPLTEPEVLPLVELVEPEVVPVEPAELPLVEPAVEPVVVWAKAVPEVRARPSTMATA